jgi:hypothetical protein
MKTINKKCGLEDYRNNMLPIWNVKTESKANISAYLIYGKFLTFLNEKDFTGAKLTKQFLRIGKVNCRHWKGNNFKKYHSLASSSEEYIELKKVFFEPCRQNIQRKSISANVYFKSEN